MTAPPRPQWLWYKWGNEVLFPSPMFASARAYIEHLERYIEQLEAQLHEPAEPLDPFWGDREPD